MLTGTQVDDDAVLAGSLHARVRACWIHARTGPTHACTGPTHACSHQVPTPARSQGPSRMLAPGPHARSLAGSPRTHARTGPCTLAHTGPPQPLGFHARTHWALHACSLRVPTPARTRGPHACVHRAYARTLAPGPHARSLAGSPCAPDPCTHACCIPCCMY